MGADGSASALVVFTTLGNVGDARSLVKQLANDQLVACGTVLDKALSIYMWRGELEEVSEAFVILKTRRGLWKALEARVQELHPYDVPELLAVPVDRGLPSYLRWMAEQTGEEVE
jgi:periplasmic divalent cation tolerance protein